MTWQNNDEGPTCTCGNPTVVKTEGLTQPMLLCLFHTYEAGAMFALPAEKPPWWPNAPTPEVFIDYMRGGAFDDPDDEPDE